jgi:hypothetical protein
MDGEGSEATKRKAMEEQDDEARWNAAWKRQSDKAKPSKRRKQSSDETTHNRKRQDAERWEAMERRRRWRRKKSSGGGCGGLLATRGEGGRKITVRRIQAAQTVKTQTHSLGFSRVDRHVPRATKTRVKVA